jgi:hypothetical protein
MHTTGWCKPTLFHPVFQPQTLYSRELTQFVRNQDGAQPKSTPIYTHSSRASLEVMQLH